MDVQRCFEDHRARVYRWAYAMCGRHEDALDVVQEVFLRMLRKPPVLPNAPAAVGWLRRVTARIVIDRWRSAASRPATSGDVVETATTQDAAETRELAEHIRAALKTLSEQQRLVLMCKCYDSMTFQQIADEIGVAVPTAKTHYLRALSAVRDRLGVTHQSGRPS